jgi:hypothetical protein
MRLIGRPDLLKLARGGDGPLRDAAFALAAELQSASWRTPAEACAAYPRARLDGHRLAIDLGDRHCAVIAINYEKGVALIEFAGAKVDSDSGRRRAKGRAA